MNKFSELFINTTLNTLISKEPKSIISGPFGSNIGKRFFQNEGIPVIRGNNLSINSVKFIDSGFVFITREKANELRCFAVPNDIIFTAVGTIGQVGLIEEGLFFKEYVISNKQIRVRFDFEKILPLYAYYWFSSKWMQNIISQRNVGSTVPLLNLSVVRGLPIKFPKSTIIQRNIVDILESITSKIELNNRINRELEQMAKLLYDYWFVQFEFPNLEGKPYKTSGGKMVWNAELKREIPEGWEVKFLKDFANTGSGGTPLSTNKEYYENGKIPWINSGELNSPYIIDGKNFITQAGLNNSSAKLFNANTLLVAMYGATAGKVSLLQLEACTNQAICAIIPNSNIYTNFLKFAFDDLYKHLINLSTGSARDNLSQDIIRDLKFIIAKEDLFIKFNQIVNPIINKISNNLKENQQLASLRDWLLPMLMNGQVTVGAKEKVSYEVAKGMDVAAEPGR